MYMYVCCVLDIIRVSPEDAGHDEILEIGCDYTPMYMHLF